MNVANSVKQQYRITAAEQEGELEVAWYDVSGA